MEKDKYDEYLQQEIFKRVSFMSNTKWKYLFAKLIEFEDKHDLTYKKQVKYLLHDKLRPFLVPVHFYAESHFEEYCGSAELKEIEYIVIPNEIVHERTNRDEILEPKIEKQEIEKMIAFLQTQGKQIEYDVTDDGVYIYGYK